MSEEPVSSHSSYISQLLSPYGMRGFQSPWFSDFFSFKSWPNEILLESPLSKTGAELLLKLSTGHSPSQGGGTEHSLKTIGLGDSFHLWQSQSQSESFYREWGSRWWLIIPFFLSYSGKYLFFLLCRGKEKQILLAIKVAIRKDQIDLLTTFIYFFNRHGWALTTDKAMYSTDPLEGD